jgi:hypothetical protein
MIYEEAKQQLMPLLSSDRPIGIFVSGGFDSSTLLYLCLSLMRENNLSTKFRAFNIPSHVGSVRHAVRVVKWMNKKFGTKVYITLVGDQDEHHSKQVLSGLQDAAEEYDHLLLGDTSNPPDLPGGPERVKSTSNRVVQPFFDFTKKDVVKLAYDMGFIEAGDLTHTCAMTTLSDARRCNQCWFCKERAWAFAANGIIDTGKM